VQNNSAYVNIGARKDTSELVDSGGSNFYRHYVFKEQLQKLSENIGIEIRGAHYPPYASKWNLVEHRFMPCLTLT
jgi:hypothetical protein